MNAIPTDLAWPNSQFDFLWSSCSIEHLGSIRKAQEFVLNSIQCVRPGGIAIHTTEFNVSSNADTVAEGETVLFRRCDIEELAKDLTAAGNLINLDFEVGDMPNDAFVDLPPYQPNPHLKLKLFEFVATSFGLAIIRAQPHSTQIELPIKNAPRCGGLRGGNFVIVDRVWKRARQGTMSIPRSSGALAPNPPRDFAVPRLRTGNPLRANLPRTLRQQFLGDLSPLREDVWQGSDGRKPGSPARNTGKIPTVGHLSR